MLYVGLDLSGKRVDVHALDATGQTILTTAVLPDRDGLRSLVRRFESFGEPVTAAVESMNGARFVHDELERWGWVVDLADAQKVRGLAPLACKTDKIDARVLAELCRRDLVPAIWLPSVDTRADRERTRWRLHLVRHRVALKNRVHAILVAHGHQCPVSDLFGKGGRRLLDSLQLPEPWAGDVAASLRLLDDLEREINACETELRRLGADHPDVLLLMTAPGIGWILASTIAAEIGDISRFASAKTFCGYTGLCPRVYQSGDTDRRGSLTKQGPPYLRWALIEAATHAALHPVFRDHYLATKKRLGKQRGSKIARVEVARKLAEAIWHMLKNHQDFRPAGPACALAA
jgi:transposase